MGSVNEYLRPGLHKEVKWVSSVFFSNKPETYTFISLIKFPRFFINKCPHGSLFVTRAKMEIGVKIREHL